MTMPLIYHYGFLQRQAVESDGVITMRDGLPPPTQEQLDETRAAAEAAWAAEQAMAELPDRRQQMAALLEAQPLAVQVAFWGVRLDVEAALERGLVSLARALVVATAVPPELEATKAEILGLFPEV